MRIADIPVPDTLAARGARALAEQYQSSAITAHAVRSWLWAEAFALVDGIRGIDHELLYVSAVLHDIGTVPEFDNHAISYEHAGGHVGVALTAGAGWWREFFTITIPGLRQELAVLITITIIAALSSFDIIYTTTLGGPGRATLVPGISIYRIGFTQSEVGLASAFGIVLMILVLAVVLPIQRLSKVGDK